MRNERTKAVGTAKTSNSCQRLSTLSAIQRPKHQRCHQEIEVYHRLYNDKINRLMEEALAKRPMPLESGASSTDADDSEQGTSDDDNNDEKSTQKTKSETTKDSRRMKAYRMKMKREVRAQAWADETTEVKDEIRQVLEKEKEEKINEEKDLLSDEKIGLERSPDQRQL